MQSVRNIKTIYILPREDYVEKALLKTWLYESENPFPSMPYVTEIAVTCFQDALGSPVQLKSVAGPSAN